MNSEKEWLEGLLTFASIAEEERKLTAAEMHDQILYNLGRLSLRASELAQTPKKSDPVCARLRQLAEDLNKVADDVRLVMENLSPSLPDHIGLLPGLESCLRRTAKLDPFRPMSIFRLRRTSYSSTKASNSHYSGLSKRPLTTFPSMHRPAMFASRSFAMARIWFYRSQMTV